MQTLCKLLLKSQPSLANFLQTHFLAPFAALPYLCTRKFNLKTYLTMPKKILSHLLTLVLLLLLMSQPAWAQTTTTVKDADLVGFWVLETMQTAGQKKTICRLNYTQVKVYRANGEYACAELFMLKDGGVSILPHEYGTYTYHDGTYTEMGRNGLLWLLDSLHFKGQWRDITSHWVRVPDVPELLVDYIVQKCRMKNDPDAIQAQARQYIFVSPTTAEK